MPYLKYYPVTIPSSVITEFAGYVPRVARGELATLLRCFESTHRLNHFHYDTFYSTKYPEGSRTYCPYLLAGGTKQEEVQIVLATKTVEPERILKATRLGYPVIGENRVQEAEEKIEYLDEHAAELQWHFIGHLQSNKVNKLVRFASMIQSIDRMKIVRKLNRRLKKVNKTIDVLIQVNTSGEDSKYGIHPTRALAFVEKASEYEHLNIKGLMTIGLFSYDWPKVRAGFRQLREIRDVIAAEQVEGVQMDHLSMGMTNDF